jgi:DnaK suppressor protein
MSRMTAEAEKVLRKRRQALEGIHQDREQEQKALQSELEPDWIDRSAAREELALLGQLGEAERRELLDIDAALARIAQGTYGRCERCSQAMGQQRLRAIPEARLCITCSSEQELGRPRPTL